MAKPPVVCRRGAHESSMENMGKLAAARTDGAALLYLGIRHVFDLFYAIEGLTFRIR